MSRPERQAFRDKAYGLDAVPVPEDSPIAEMACDLAGCSGTILASLTTGQVWLLDGGELVLWSGLLEVKEKPE